MVFLESHCMYERVNDRKRYLLSNFLEKFSEGEWKDYISYYGMLVVSTKVWHFIRRKYLSIPLQHHVGYDVSEQNIMWRVLVTRILSTTKSLIFAAIMIALKHVGLSDSLPRIRGALEHPLFIWEMSLLLEVWGCLLFWPWQSGLPSCPVVRFCISSKPPVTTVGFKLGSSSRVFHEFFPTLLLKECCWYDEGTSKVHSSLRRFP